MDLSHPHHPDPVGFVAFAATVGGALSWLFHGLVSLIPIAAILIGIGFQAGSFWLSYRGSESRLKRLKNQWRVEWLKERLAERPRMPTREP